MPAKVGIQGFKNLGFSWTPVFTRLRTFCIFINNKQFFGAYSRCKSMVKIVLF